MLGATGETYETCWRSLERRRRHASNHLRYRKDAEKSLERRRKHGVDHFSDVVNMLEITGETEACWRLLERRRKQRSGDRFEDNIDTHHQEMCCKVVDWGCITWSSEWVL